MNPKLKIQIRRNQPVVASPGALGSDPAADSTIPTELRVAFYAFIASIPFEAAGSLSGADLSIAKVTGLILIAVALLRPAENFGKPPITLAWFAGYGVVFFMMSFLIEEEYRE